MRQINVFLSLFNQYLKLKNSYVHDFFQIHRANRVSEYDMVCAATNSSGPILPVGYPRTLCPGRSRCDDHSHTGERPHREPSQDIANQADEV